MKPTTKASLSALGILALGGVVHAINPRPESSSNSAAARFRESGVIEIGVRSNPQYNPTRFGSDLQHYPQVETKAFWVQLPTSRRLALYQRGHSQVPGAGDKRCLLGAGCYRISNEEAQFLVERDRADNVFHFNRFVPDEFRDAAIAMHSARWKTAPEEHEAGMVELLNEGVSKR